MFHRLYLLWLAPLALAGCASAVSPPPITPDTEKISVAAAEIKGTGLPSRDYASVGITLATKACNDWFTGLVKQAQGANFGTSELNLLGGAASAAGAAGGPYGAAFGAILSLLSSSIGNYQSSSGVGSIPPGAARGLVKRAQDAWLSAMPTPLDDADAFALVESYAEICQPPAVLQAIQEAMMTAPMTVTTPGSPVDAGASLLGADRHPSRVRLPVVTIGRAPPTIARAQPIGDRRAVDHVTRARLSTEAEAVARYGRNAVERGPRRLPPPRSVRAREEPAHQMLAPAPIPPAAAFPPPAPAPTPQTAPTEPGRAPERWKF